MPKSPPEENITQSERFMQAARELECDDDPDRFKGRVKKLAKAQVAPTPKGADTVTDENS